MKKKEKLKNFTSVNLQKEKTSLLTSISQPIFPNNLGGPNNKTRGWTTSYNISTTYFYNPSGSLDFSQVDCQTKYTSDPFSDGFGSNSAV